LTVARILKLPVLALDVPGQIFIDNGEFFDDYRGEMGYTDYENGDDGNDDHPDQRLASPGAALGDPASVFLFPAFVPVITVHLFTI